jgi:hypothetical protein
MRTLIAVGIGIVLLPAISAPDRPDPPTVSADTMRLAEVRRASDTLLVERPIHAKEHATSSVFVVGEGEVLRRVAVTYGRASTSMIQITGGVAPGDRIVVSDVRSWDQFERIRIRSR